MLLAASTARNIAVLIAVVLVVGWILYVIANMRRGRREVGAELELAPNRAPGISDDELEGPRLERVQLYGLLLLVVIVLTLPLYWLFEPGRESGAVEEYHRQFVARGAELFDTTANGGFNCAGCHGGMSATGGAAPYSITDAATGEVRQVTWKAPALNTVLYRYSRDEVRFVLVYGRQFSPMSPWGIAGGGPMNDQQISNVIDYIESIQIPKEGCPADAPLCEEGTLPQAQRDEIQAEIDAQLASGAAGSVGEAIFNLELASGAYSCARCHTRGWSYSEPQVTGGGAFGPNLTGGSEVRQFPTVDENIDFIIAPPEAGKAYGAQGQSSGRMPAFGSYYSEEQLRELVEYIRSL
jgi:mono/diheme cytochrome c family protein